MPDTKLANIEAALEDLRQGRMVIVVDDEDRENEGDLIIAAERATSEAINFMMREGRGLVCLAMQQEDFERLQIPMVRKRNQSHYQTPFGVSIEAVEGVTTGISACDRACTIKTAIDNNNGPDAIAMPGHVFPLRAKSGGVLQRNGHTEAAVDLARLCGLKPSGVICEIINDDGTMARMPQLQLFADKHGLNIISIKDLQSYRIKNEILIELQASAKLPIDDCGVFDIHVYRSLVDGAEHVALVKKPLDTSQACLVRLHSECLTGDLFHSQRCDCGSQLNMSLAKIAQQGGVLLYLRQEGRGIGLSNKIKAYALQEQGLDTVEANLKLGFKADERDYGMAAQILKELNINAVKLLTNNPRKVAGLEDYGVCVEKRVALEVSPNQNNIHYLQTKLNKMRHLLNLEEPVNV